MSAVERLQAAIDRLEHLRDEATAGEWEVDTNAPFSRALVGIFSEKAMGYAVKFDDDQQPDRATADLIATLHRTIDAQLAILRDVLEAANVERHWETLVYTRNALVLADTILGDQS